MRAVGARPYTVIFSTATVDGRIASSTGYSMLSCSYDLTRLRLLRGAAEAVMVGASTVLLDNPSLRKRLEPRSDRYYRVVVDGRLRIHEDLRLLREPGPPVIVFTATRDPEKIRRLESRGARVHLVGDDGVIDLGEAMRILVTVYGVRRLLVEGGGVLNYSMLREGLVDELRVTYTPYVFAAGRSVVDDPEARGFATTSESPRLRLVCMEKCPCGNCVHAAYRVESTCCPPASGPYIEPCLSQKLRGLTTRAEQLYEW
ncbi:hypothetical protein CF15_00800 [Pyrodictium occultum]|uniref:Bacterial bifunctional deaminase-reductase C-terminal domain-containing protein n=1 Tax=Pyrodictium occultum TaxID=2309 RepID=A0A0V8RTP1_PYROC|nr:dihydrofolate reductase family protein [Pyrodictium occultum]KSW11430.1 hypothetical protein CF15_00800 [Pyrodictium occultum]